MSDHLEIRFRPSEGALLRLVGLVERRGYEVRAMDLPTMEPGSPAILRLAVIPRDDSRRLPVLLAHLSKVFGVEAVRCIDNMARGDAAS